MNHKLNLKIVASIIIIIFITSHLLQAQAIPVELVKNQEGNWQLLRAGQPYYILGAGGTGSKKLLAQAGANTFRTWGVSKDLGKQLDEAHGLGLAVVVGHWLGQPRHGFDYSDTKALEKQFARVRSDVLKYKDHPAVLIWAIGNEMEGFAEGDDPAVWTHVQAIAAMIKEIDPHHPTMTVTAEIGGKRVELIHQLCPDLDIMGINSYGGVPSIPERYRKLNGTKPYIITELGPPGVWEIELTEFGAPPELTSTQKAIIYRDSFKKGCLDESELCLGGFAFTWGSKLEVTSTWYGMFLPSGDKLGCVDTMTELWSGKPLQNLCPEIRSFGLVGSNIVEPGDIVKVELDIVDPEGAELEVSWQIFQEAPEYLIGEETQWIPLELEGIITTASAKGATLKMPGGGIYRLYMTAQDGSGAAATANVPIKVKGEPGRVKLKLPLAVYSDDAPQPWFPSGWMGNSADLEIDPASTVLPHSGESCMKIYYHASHDWTGVAWQHPANDWGNKPGGYNLTGATKLTFWARGEMGGEELDFGVGLLDSDKEYYDTTNVKLKGVKLKKQWKRYTINLKNKDLSKIKTPFVWTLLGTGHSLQFYLDDIYFE